MQIVLVGNRIVAHGEGCFLSMGGTVVCDETGKAYQNATIAEVETVPADIGEVGYEYHAGQFVPCAPFGEAEDGAIMVACDECATPRRSGALIKDLLSAVAANTEGVSKSCKPITGTYKGTGASQTIQIGGSGTLCVVSGGGSNYFSVFTCGGMISVGNGSVSGNSSLYYKDGKLVVFGTGQANNKSDTTYTYWAI